MSGDEIPRCRSCHDPIKWAITSKGKRIPLDIDPRDDGNVTLELEPGGVLRATVHGKPDETIPAGEKRFISHFATCVTALQHRRGRAQKAST